MTLTERRIRSYAILIFSSLTVPSQNRFEDFKERVGNILRDLKLPVRLLASTQYDPFRFPAPAAWLQFERRWNGDKVIGASRALLVRSRALADLASMQILTSPSTSVTWRAGRARNSTTTTVRRNCRFSPRGGNLIKVLCASQSSQTTSMFASTPPKTSSPASRSTRRSMSTTAGSLRSTTTTVRLPGCPLGAH